MAKFKVGDRVEILGDKAHAGHWFSPGSKGTILKRSGTYSYEVQPEGFTSRLKSRFVSAGDLKLIDKRGRLSKPKLVKYIAKYEEEGRDPYKEFTSKKELNEWLRVQQLTLDGANENIIFDSIVVYPVGKPMKVEQSFRLKAK